MENSKIKILDLDFVFISFREPNCEENYADLLNKVPWAKRVHGVVGFDSAHKAAAEAAETDFFISVDGDNIIDESFLLQTLDWSRTNSKHVHRWRGENNINGLIYGNGGLVGWHKETCLGMRTHENADDARAKVDFCWTVPHANLHNCYSKTIINATPQQAFVAGYREGVKMSINQGKRIAPINFKEQVPHPNMICLLTWMSVGADVENGKYAMLGARMGCYNTVIQNLDHEDVSNLDKIVEMCPNDGKNIDDDLVSYGESLKQRLDIPIADYNSTQSKFFKFCQPKWKNRGVQDLEDK
jgi:hypothetical protein